MSSALVHITKYSFEFAMNQAGGLLRCSTTRYSPIHHTPRANTGITMGTSAALPLIQVPVPQLGHLVGEYRHDSTAATVEIDFSAQ